jgi:exopolysaccharide biosynthesis polyprenyl glycosylphosphotransferase
MLKVARDGKKLFFIVIVVADATSVVCAFFVAYLLRNEGPFRLLLDVVQPLTFYLKVLPLTIASLLLMFASKGLYSLKMRTTIISETYAIIQSTTLWALFLMAASYLSKIDYSRIILLMFYVLTSIFLFVERFFLRKLQLRWLPHGFGRTNVLIIGTGRKAQEVYRSLRRYTNAGLHVVGFVSSKINNKGETKHLLNKWVVGPLSSLNLLINKYNIHEVYIADPNLSQEQILTLIARSAASNLKFKVVANVFGLIIGHVDLANLENVPTLDVGRMRFSWWKRVSKSFFDFFCALILMIVTLPLWLVIAIAIKLDSPGKVLLRQKRVGLNGKVFTLYKFRTMHAHEPLYQMGPVNSQDKRVTRVGKFLRRHSLDELPQLINILKGEMSFVGPRPEMPFIVRKYNAWERRRLAVKPGLTGLWQILGRKDLPLTQNLEYDFYYISNQSFILDIVILLKTIPLVIQGKGAY